jgi:polyvinyl alcohol dehydrogenase (cytochrome)
MFALDAKTGNILWTFLNGGSVNSGAAIVDGVVHWGSGYARISGTPNNKFYAFEVKPIGDEPFQGHSKPRKL